MVNSGNTKVPLNGWDTKTKKTEEQGVWKDTEQKGRGEIKKRLAHHIKELTQSRRNGTPQKTLNRIVKVSNLYFVKITLEVTWRGLRIK